MRRALALVSALAAAREGAAQRLPPQTFASFDVAPCPGDPPAEAWLRELEFELRTLRVLPYLPTPDRARIRAEHRLTVRGMRCAASGYELSSAPAGLDALVAVNVDLGTTPAEERPRVAALRLAELVRQQRRLRDAPAEPAAVEAPPRSSLTGTLLLQARGSLATCRAQLEALGELGIPVSTRARFVAALGGGGCASQESPGARVDAVVRGSLGVDGTVAARSRWSLRLGRRLSLAGTVVSVNGLAGTAVPTVDAEFAAEAGLRAAPGSQLVLRVGLGYTVVGAVIATPAAPQGPSPGAREAITTVTGPFATVALGWRFGDQ